MITLRKIDFYSQITLGIIMVLSVPVLFLVGFRAGLLILGCWQLISAGLNTSGFINSGHKKEIVSYWKWAGLDLLAISICFPLSALFDPNDAQVFFWIAAGCAVLISAYYWKIYDRLIKHFELRKELSGFTKSNR
jgi:hypothetical protein